MTLYRVMDTIWASPVPRWDWQCWEVRAMARYGFYSRMSRSVPVTNDVGRVWLSWSDASGSWVVKDAAGAVTAVPAACGGADRWNFKRPAGWAKWRFPRMTVILDSGR